MNQHLFQPLCNDVEGWCRLCFGRLSPPGTRTEPVSPQDEGNEDERLKFTGSLPYTHIIMAMDQVRNYFVLLISSKINK